MSNKKETDLDGCHVTVEKKGGDKFHATVTYRSYNTKGEHVASPAWENIGNKSETKAFVIREVVRASDHNKPKE